VEGRHPKIFKMCVCACLYLGRALYGVHSSSVRRIDIRTY